MQNPASPRARRLVALVAAITLTGAAQAAEFSVANGLLNPAASGKLTLSNDSDPAGSSVVGAFSLINTSVPAAVRAAAPGTVFFGVDASGYETAAVAAPLTRIVTDAQTRVTDVYSQGGLTLSAIVTTASKGGSITIGNLHGDLVNGIIYADVYGTPTYSGGVAFSQNNVPFFTWAAFEGETSMPGIVPYQAKLHGLTATAEAKSLMTNALGLRGIGLSTLNALTNYGTLEVSAPLLTPPPVPDVPEPSTYALMGLGVGAASWMARRRRR